MTNTRFNLFSDQLSGSANAFTAAAVLATQRCLASCLSIVTEPDHGIDIQRRKISCSQLWVHGSCKNAKKK